MKLLWLLGLVMSSVAYSQTFVGRTIPPAPAGLVDKGGACVSYELGHDGSCEYAIGFLGAADGTEEYVYGARFERRDNNGSALYRITDNFAVSALRPGHQLMYISCERNRTPDDKIVAVVKIDEAVDRQTKVIFAKRYDLASERFVDVPAKEVSCIVEGWNQ